jgi:predicted amidohydrolase YtcJ
MGGRKRVPRSMRPEAERARWRSERAGAPDLSAPGRICFYLSRQPELHKDSEDMPMPDPTADPMPALKTSPRARQRGLPKALGTALGAAAIMLLAGCGTEDATATDAADLILVGGTVITLDADVPEAEAVAIRQGRILAVGSREAIEALAGPRTERIDLDGRFVSPGFIEGHGHFLGLGQARMILDLSRATTWDEIVAIVAEAAATAEPGAWITGRGWHQERWDPAPAETYDGVPTHHGLSEVSPANPVLLTHASGHGSFANALALEAAGITADTPNPEGGFIVRDSEGNATGFLRQAAQLPARAALQRFEEGMSDEARTQRFRRQVELAGEEALRHGITSFHDQGKSFAEIDGLRAMAAAGELPVRLHVAVRGESNESMDARLADYRMIGFGDHFLTVRAIKRQIDGALGTHGAWLLDPYTDMPSSSGLPQVTMESLEETARTALRHGYQLNTHAIGDRGNREALDIYARVMAEGAGAGAGAGAGDAAGADLRWRIEHAQNLHPDEVPRFAAMGVIASMQGIHATSDGPWVPQRLGEERSRRRAYVWRSLLDAGAVICNGTDVPVEPISAIASYHASVTRLMRNGNRFFPEQSMDRMEALLSYTMGCAYAGFEEDLLGSITPGKLADLVVLDQNLLTAEEDALARTEVVMTIVGGEIRYQR